MLTVLALLLHLVTHSTPSVQLAADPTKGQTPLAVTFTITVAGPYQGAVCLVIMHDSTPLGKPGCFDEKADVADGAKQEFTLKLTGTKAGTYQFQAFLAEGEEFTLSNVVEITTTDPPNQD